LAEQPGGGGHQQQGPGQLGGPALRRSIEGGISLPGYEGRCVILLPRGTSERSVPRRRSAGASGHAFHEGSVRLDLPPLRTCHPPRHALPAYGPVSHWLCTSEERQRHPGRYGRHRLLAHPRPSRARPRRPGRSRSKRAHAAPPQPSGWLLRGSVEEQVAHDLARRGGFRVLPSAPAGVGREPGSCSGPGHLVAACALINWRTDSY
jgi:hypothetical protein